MVLLNMLLKKVVICKLYETLIYNVTVITATAPFGNCLNSKLCCAFQPNEQLRLYLFNRKNSVNKGIQLPIGDLERLDSILTKNSVDRSLKTVIYVHGFSEGAPDGESGIAIRDAYLQSGDDFNIILVDWRYLAALPWYVSATRNCDLVAKYLRLFVENLESAGFPIENLHLIGFSLGAHVVGLTGKKLRDSNGKPKLHRITGLDPALPLFTKVGPKSRIGVNDAKFVDIIHGDAGLVGLPDALGHADFYPNDGRHYQPGCEPGNFRLAGPLDISLFISCSHRRAWMFYADTVMKPKTFPATNCHNRTLFPSICQEPMQTFMGFGADPKSRGSFYLKTNSVAPFGRSILLP